MKEGWEYCQLEDAVKKGSSNISLNKIKGEDGEYPVFAAKGFVQNVSFYHQEEDYLAIIKDGAGIGRVSKHPAKSSVVGTMQYLIPKEGFDIDFIKYFLEGIDFEKHRNGSTIPHIYFKDYKSEKFPNIPLPEQQCIVSILDQAFAAIDKAKANAEENLQNAKELFESYLQGVFEKKGDGWIQTTLSDLFNVKHGFAFQGKYFSNNGEYVLLTPGNFYEEGGYRDRGEKQKYYNGKIPSDFILKKGDLLVAMTEQAAGLLGSPIIVPESNKFLHNQRLGLIIPKQDVEIDNEFFYHVFNLKKVRQALHDSGTGVKVRHTSPKKIGQVEISYPKKKKEQQTIVRQLDDLRAETQKLETVYQKKMQDLEELKKSVLQKAFTGELEIEKAVVV